jgi:hypothetical protein
VLHETKVMVVDAPGATLGAADVTRRYGLAFPDGVTRFPGVTRPEAQKAAVVLSDLAPERWPAALVVVVLPVLLSDGAGPHLVDASGGLVLVVGAHPAGEGRHVAMAAVDATDVGGAAVIGVVRERRGGVWVWEGRATVDSDRRIAALDDLDAVRGDDELAGWLTRWE